VARVAALVVLEATGRYEAARATALARDGLDPTVFFAERVRPLPDGESEALQAILARRRQIIGMLVAEKNRAHVAAPAIRKSVTKHLRWLGKELGTVSDEFAWAIKSSPTGGGPPPAEP